MNQSDLDDYRWLVSPAADRLINDAIASPLSMLAQAKQLRKQVSTDRARLILEQADLRVRARAKFSAADRMLFTRTGLEQSTDEWVARYKARRFRDHASVADLCCGIGGDLLALAELDRTRGVDRDPIKTIFAAANIERVCLTKASIQSGDAMTVDLTSFGAWHIDPDRRATGRRTSSVHLQEPSAAQIDTLLSRNPHAGIKLSPAARPESNWAESAELEWISRGGECRQQVAWFGSLTQQRAIRTATRVFDNEEPAATISGDLHLTPPRTDLKRYLFEPDRAVLAADLTGVLAAQLQLSAFSAGIAYLTGDRPVTHPLLSAFEVLEVIPFRIKRLKTLLRQRSIGHVEVKKRGVPLDPASLRRALAGPGDGTATVILTRVADGVTAILARRLPATDSAP